MKTLKNWTLAAQHADHVELLVDERHRFCLYVLENDLFRVLIKREGELALDRTWSIAPQEDVPWEGRDRLSVAGFSLPGYQLRQEGERLVVSTPRLRVTVHQPLWLAWEYCNAAGEWRPLAADRPTSAYLLNAHGDGVAHYQRRFADERYYGLGESRRSGAHRPPLRDAQSGRHGLQRRQHRSAVQAHSVYHHPRAGSELRSVLRQP